ncbi:hypothetical protein KB559_18490 [Paenibacillus sp. Marseille-P2973]|uniref:hypothetical protein n=1 Tax=Paenibacillus sp. Marseille-P2973 TaxID=1871032 RepID=UPI001B37087B|nr:hypothetical protein [Paenibacillus sp. Marseille-P2973]MBQ4900830.1 hypothetical protein [Paenibacillus sp. Marseille-P2973]
MNGIDKRNKLEEHPFLYRTAKNGAVFLEYFGKVVKMLKGKEAERFLEKVNAAKDEKELQLLLAKATGNFKRGNERPLKM